MYRTYDHYFCTKYDIFCIGKHTFPVESKDNKIENGKTPVNKALVHKPYTNFCLHYVILL